MNVFLPARLIVFLILPVADAQLFYVGIKGGTPFSSSGSSIMVGGRTGFGLSTLNVRRYSVGPTFEVAIPFGFRLEADSLYRRLDTTEHRFFSPAFGAITRFAANSWDFPLLLKYQWGHHRLRPFAAAGGAFRLIPSFQASMESFAAGFQPPHSLVRYRLEHSLIQGGMAFGGGMRIISAGPIKVTPEIRYIRWTSLRFLPTKNQVEFLVGVGF